MTEDLIKYSRAKPVPVKVINSERISFTCEPGLAKAIRARAEIEGRSVSVTVRNLMKELLTRLLVYDNIDITL